MALVSSSITQTRNVPVVAVPVFQHNCIRQAEAGVHSSQQRLESWTSQHVCPDCGVLQPLLAHENYFSALGVLPRFTLDRSLLEKHFYELLRVLHPDRFTTSSPETKALSLDRMSFVNRAYTTLKNPIQLRDYLLELEGFQVFSPRGQSKPKNAGLPMELAEAWFEVQDLLTEGPGAAQEKLIEFEAHLGQLKTKIVKDLEEWEKAYDHAPSRSWLEKIAEGIQTLSYLNSMQRDVERIKTNAHSN